MDVVGGKGEKREKRLIKYCSEGVDERKQGSEMGEGMRGGRTRQEQRTGVGGFMGNRGEKEKNHEGVVRKTARGRAESRGSGEESEM